MPAESAPPNDCDPLSPRCGTAQLARNRRAPDYPHVGVPPGAGIPRPRILAKFTKWRSPMRAVTSIGRRKFLERAGLTAALGAVGGRAAPLAAARILPRAQAGYDFDEIYDRVGTDSTKWDAAIAAFGDQIEVGMGVADMDFRAAPCITRALAERCAHENWG